MQQNRQRASKRYTNAIVICAILAMTPWVCMVLGVLVYAILKVT